MIRLSDYSCILSTAVAVAVRLEKAVQRLRHRHIVRQPETGATGLYVPDCDT